MTTFTTCSRCELRSTLASAFKKQSAKAGGETLCPRCALKARIEEAADTRKRALLNAAVALVLGLFAFREVWFFANLSIGVPVVTVVSIVCHELGHAAAARLLGFDVFRIVLGIGPRRFETRFLGFRWDVRKYLANGLVQTASPHDRARLTRTIAMTAAGPAANLLLAAAGIAVFSLSGYAENPFAGPAPLGTLVLVNALLGISNLVPFKTARGGDSDGRSIWLSLTRRPERRRQFRDSYYWLKLAELHEREDATEAKRTAQAAIETNPASAAFRTFLAVQHLRERRYREACSAFEAALECSQDAAGTAMARSNLAFGLLAKGDLDDRPCGDDLSARAYDVLPWSTAVAHSRASYLILAGRPAEAVVAIEQVLEEDMSDKGRKETLYTLALAHERAGNATRAAQLRADAERLAGDVLRCIERPHPLQPSAASPF